MTVLSDLEDAHFVGNEYAAFSFDNSIEIHFYLKPDLEIRSSFHVIKE